MHSPTSLLTMLLLILPLVVIGLFFFARYTGLARLKAFYTLLAASIAGGVYAFVRLDGPRNFPRMHGKDAEIFYAMAAGASFLFITAFVLRLWGRWIGEHATEAECLPGKPGIRAWFSAPNIAVGTTVVLLVWFGFDISPILTSLLIAGLLAAQPLLQMDSINLSKTPGATPGSPNLSTERDKILAMLEAGKLTAEESAELLQALGASTPPPVPQKVPLSNNQRLLLVGAGLVLLGFFLPWFVINPGQELGQMTAQMNSAMNHSISLDAFGERVEMPRVQFPTGAFPSVNVSVSGGDIGKGLGWATLLLALGAAILPYLNTSLDAATVRTIRLLSLGIGAIIVLYLLTQNIRFASVGIVLVVAGYVLEIVGTLRGEAVAVYSDLHGKPVRP